MAKRFINSRDTVVRDLMSGLALNSSLVTLLDPKGGHNIAIRTAVADGSQTPRVSVVSGGGSGHEPMAAGYVGNGMLTAAVAGEVFASPSVSAVCTMLQAIAPKSTGILVVVMNYQGDKLNFGGAVEEFKQLNPDVPVKMIFVQDDVALPHQTDRRGIAGTIFVIKVAGAAADQGRSLDEVAMIAEAAAASVVSYGVALEPCTIPGHEVDENRLRTDELELGMGIHGEPGAETQSIKLKNMAHFTENIMYDICERLDKALSLKEELVSDCKGLVIMVNNLGAVPQSEMLIVSLAVAHYLDTGDGQVINGNLHPVHMFCGSFMTSLQMNGVSITCLVLSRKNEVLEQMLHAPTVCQSWSKGIKLRPPSDRPSFYVSFGNEQAKPGAKAEEKSTNAVKEGSKGVLSLRTEKYITAITDSLLSKYNELGALDRLTGDGDLGDTVRKACEKVKSDLDVGSYSKAAGKPHLLFSLIADSAGESGGSMGVFTRIFLQEMAAVYKTHADAGSLASWRDAFVQGTNAVMQRGGANVGDRTLVDALKPAADVLATQNGTLTQAAQAAHIGSESTKRILKSKFGRSKNVDSRKLQDLPDPGSVLVCIMLDAVVVASGS
ncbi:unnamed protein product [Agarophyton chilense]